MYCTKFLERNMDTIRLLEDRAVGRSDLSQHANTWVLPIDWPIVQ